MKIIDLLNKIAKGEEAPKKIMYNNVVWEYVNHEQDYRSRHNAELFFNDEINNTWIMTHLNTQIEILEEEKKIPEKIKDKYCSQISKVELAQKYNEIIDYLDYLKSKGDE